MLLDDGEEFRVHFGDCIEHMATMPAASVDFAVFSPPFPGLYAYTSSPADIGNSEDLDNGEARLHLSFFYRQLARIVKPGRVVMVHVAQIPRMKRASGRGLFDFRGLNIRVSERAGLIFEYDWSVRKNPQSQAIRTKSHNLQFSGLERDRVNSRGAIPDYLLKFTAPGDNAVPVRDWEDELDADGDKIGKKSLHNTQVARNDWIEWAEGCWRDIKETETLNARKTSTTDGREVTCKGPEDTKHICPLQLGVIDRLVRLYTNPGELVFSPFTGIGSEGYVSLKRGRRFYGCELKKEYYDAALANLARSIKLRNVSAAGLFDNAVAVGAGDSVVDVSSGDMFGGDDDGDAAGNVGPDDPPACQNCGELLPDADAAAECVACGYAPLRDKTRDGVIDPDGLRWRGGVDPAEPGGDWTAESEVAT